MARTKPMERPRNLLGHQCQFIIIIRWERNIGQHPCHHPVHSSNASECYCSQGGDVPLKLVVYRVLLFLMRD